MKKILITGFDPFGGQSVNPAWEAVQTLPDVIGDASVTRLMIPTVFGAAAEKVISAMQTLQPDIVLCIGQAGGREKITFEVAAINIQHAGIPDNAGVQPVFEPITPEGPAAFLTTLPVHDLQQRLHSEGYPVSLSFSAGTFVCNDVFYRVLQACEGSNTRMDFIHVPFLPEQAQGRFPSLPLETITGFLTRLIELL